MKHDLAEMINSQTPKVEVHKHEPAPSNNIHQHQSAPKGESSKQHIPQKFDMNKQPTPSSKSNPKQNPTQVKLIYVSQKKKTKTDINVPFDIAFKGGDMKCSVKGEPKEIVVQIPTGVKDNEIVTVENHEFIIHIENSEIFSRDGDDLYCIISPAQKEVKHPNGEKFKVDDELFINCMNKLYVSKKGKMGYNNKGRFVLITHSCLFGKAEQFLQIVERRKIAAPHTSISSISPPSPINYTKPAAITPPFSPTSKTSIQHQNNANPMFIPNLPMNQTPIRTSKRSNSASVQKGTPIAFDYKANPTLSPPHYPQTQQFSPIQKGFVRPQHQESNTNTTTSKPLSKIWQQHTFQSTTNKSVNTMNWFKLQDRSFFCIVNSFKMSSVKIQLPSGTKEISPIPSFETPTLFKEPEGEFMVYFYEQMNEKEPLLNYEPLKGRYSINDKDVFDIRLPQTMKNKRVFVEITNERKSIYSTDDSNIPILLPIYHTGSNKAVIPFFKFGPTHDSLIIVNLEFC
ncbi:Uncharacterized protein QTN25_001433 [Entamoeba marina]